MHKAIQWLANRTKPNQLRKLLVRIAPPLSALILAILFSALTMALIGRNPLIAFPMIISGAFASKISIAEVLVKTTPLLIVGIGTAFAFRCQMWNIGAEGQMLIGALCAGGVALASPEMPAIALIPLAVVAAFIGGGIWGGIAGFLKATRGASEIINTIMLNYVAVYLTNYLVTGPLKETKYLPQSKLFPLTANLPQLMLPTRLNIGLLIGILSAVIIAIILWRTSLGFSIFAVGTNIKAARTGGISVGTTMTAAMFVSGGLAGIAGAVEVLGLYHRIMDGTSAGYGFSAMAVAILGALNPLGIAVFAFLFA
ncbi:MAG: ABC transporter permease, partial [Anaerolineaceae bacterium]